MDTGTPSPGIWRRQSFIHPTPFLAPRASMVPNLVSQDGLRGRKFNGHISFQQQYKPRGVDGVAFPHGPEQSGDAQGLYDNHYSSHEQPDASQNIGNFDFYSGQSGDVPGFDVYPYFRHEQSIAPHDFGNFSFDHGQDQFGSAQLIDSDQQLDLGLYGPRGPQSFGDAPMPDDRVDEASKDVPAIDLVQANAYASTIKGKEDRAAKVIQRQNKQTDAAKKMGVDITILRTATGVAISGIYWINPGIDATIPSSAADIIDHTNALVTAMQNNEGCREKGTTKAFLNRWSPNSTYYTQEDFEACCGKLLTAMIDIHRNGWTQDIFDKAERASYQKTMFYTFQDRFDAVCELLTYSKNSCIEVMKGAKIYVMIGNPRVLIKRTATNKEANRRKEERIAIGTKVQKAQTAKHKELVHGQDQGEQPQEDETPGSDFRHSKKTKAAVKCKIAVPRGKTTASKDKNTASKGKNIASKLKDISLHRDDSEEDELPDPEFSPSPKPDKVFKGRKRGHVDNNIEGYEGPLNPFLQEPGLITKHRDKKARYA